MYTSAELSEQMADYEIEPWGEVRADLRAAIIAATVANFAGKVAKKESKPSDFIPKFEAEPPKTADWQDLKSRLRGFFDRHNKRCQR